MTKRLLVVDDDPAIREVVKDYLSGDGWEVEQAKTGTQGLALAQRRAYDVILLDVKLPDGEGTDFCLRLKSRPALARVAVFMMSGLATGTADKIAGLSLGAVDYVAKPLQLEELRARLNAIVEVGAAWWKKQDGRNA